MRGLKDTQCGQWLAQQRACCRSLVVLPAYGFTTRLNRRCTSPGHRIACSAQRVLRSPQCVSSPSVLRSPQCVSSPSTAERFGSAASEGAPYCQKRTCPAFRLALGTIATLDDSEFDRLARSWRDTEEFEGWKEDEVFDLLRQVSDLAETARLENQSLFLWTEP